MDINRTAEYVVLWKSHQRAEWAAVGLDNQADALWRQLEQGLQHTRQGEDNLRLPADTARSTAPASILSAVSDPATPVRRHRTETREEGREKAPGAALATLQAVFAADHATAAAVAEDIFDELKWLEAESRRMWRLHAEIGLELAQAAALLTLAQRKSAEKALKQWVKAEVNPAP